MKANGLSSSRANQTPSAHLRITTSFVLALRKSARGRLRLNDECRLIRLGCLSSLGRPEVKRRLLQNAATVSALTALVAKTAPFDPKNASLEDVQLLNAMGTEQLTPILKVAPCACAMAIDFLTRFLLYC